LKTLCMKAVLGARGAAGASGIDDPTEVETVPCRHVTICSRWVRMPTTVYGRRGSRKTHLFLETLGESFLSASTAFLLRGNGLWTNVHSCLWNSHRTQRVAPSWITQRLFLLLHASQGRSRRERMLETGPLLEVGLVAAKDSLVGEGFCGLRGRAAAMGTGAGRGIAGCIASTVVISLSQGTNSAPGIDKGGYR
jgi:hypothetical protein